MRIYIYDMIDGERLLELQLITFANGKLTARLADNYISKEGEDPTDISDVQEKELGIDFSDKTNRGRCWVSDYNKQTQELKINVSLDELENRRKFVRVNLNSKFDIVLTRPYVRKTLVKAIDISYGGFGFESIDTLELGQEATLILPTIRNEVHIDGKIVRKHGDTQYGMMFEDVEYQERVSDSLYSFITSHSR